MQQLFVWVVVAIELSRGAAEGALVGDVVGAGTGIIRWYSIQGLATIQQQHRGMVFETFVFMTIYVIL